MSHKLSSLGYGATSGKVVNKVHGAVQGQAHFSLANIFYKTAKKTDKLSHVRPELLWPLYLAKLPLLSMGLYKTCTLSHVFVQVVLVPLVLGLYEDVRKYCGRIYLSFLMASHKHSCQYVTYKIPRSHSNT